jgi:hypothetical protein
VLLLLLAMISPLMQLFLLMRLLVQMCIHCFCSCYVCVPDTIIAAVDKFSVANKVVVATDANFHVIADVDGIDDVVVADDFTVHTAVAEVMVAAEQCFAVALAFFYDLINCLPYLRNIKQKSNNHTC